MTTYTYEILKFLAIKHKHIIVDNPTDADFILVSLNSFYEIDKLIKIRKNYKRKQIIVGGHLSYAPAPLLAFADYINLGQGFEFFKNCKELDDFKSQEFIYHKDKKYGRFSYYINWDDIPVIQIGKNSYSYWWSVGCKNKCNFCATSYTNLYQVNPNYHRLNLIRDKYSSKKQVTVITNDYSNSNISRNMSDATIDDFISHPNKFKNIKLIRIGLETIDIRFQKIFNKVIEQDKIKEMFKILNDMNKNCNIFIMLGFQSTEEFLEFKSCIDRNFINSRPRINLICNYFNPNVATPLEDFDITSMQWVDLPYIKYKLKAYNSRFVIYKDLTLKPINACINTLKERSNENTILDVLKLHDKVYRNFNDFWEDVDKLNLMSLAKGIYEHPQIEMPYAKLKEFQKQKIQGEINEYYTRRTRS